MLICSGSYNEILDLVLTCVEDNNEYWDTSNDNKIVSKYVETVDSGNNDDEDKDVETADDLEILYDTLWNWTYKVNEKAKSPTVMVEEDWTDIEWKNRGCDHFPASAFDLINNAFYLVISCF